MYYEGERGEVDIGMMRRWCFALVLGLVACSQDVAPPAIYSPRDPVNTEACRNTSFSLQYMTAQSSRDIVKCLNGENGALQPIKDFLDEVPTEDLEALFVAPNRYLGAKGTRANQVLDLIERLNRTGLADELYKNLDVLTATDLLQSLPPLLSTVLEDPKRPGQLDPHLLDALPALQRAASDGTLPDNLILSARAFNGSRAKSLAVLFGREVPGTPLNASDYVDRLMPFLGGSEPGDFAGLLWGLSDPKLLSSFQSLSSVEASDLAALMQEIPLGSVQGTQNTLSKLKSVVLTTDRPVRCFNNGKTEQIIQNTFDMFASEMVLRRTSTDLLGRFLLVEAPVLISATVSNCDLDPAGSQHFPVFMKLAQKGHAPGLAASVGLFKNPNRLEYLKQASKNPLMDKAGALLENIAYRKGFSYLTEMVRADIRPGDFQALARLSGYLLYPQWSSAQVQNWLKNNLDAPHKDPILRVFSGLPEKQKTLASLLEVAEGKVSDESILHLRFRMRDRLLGEGAAVSLEQLARKLATHPQAKEDIKRIAKALVLNWGHAGTGLGYLLGISAESLDLASEEPLMNFLADLFQDRALIEETGPSLIRLLRHPKMVPALRHVGVLAGSGDLDRIVDFLSEISRNKKEPGLLTPERPRRYTLNKNAVNQPTNYEKGYQQPIPPSGDYSACFSISGDLLAAGGGNLFSALKCLDARGGAPGFSKTAEILQSTGTLAPFTELASRRLINKAYIHDVLKDLTGLRTSGDLNRVLKLLRISLEPNFSLPAKMDPLVFLGLQSLRSDQVLDGVGDLLSLGQFQTGVQQGLELLEQKADRRVLRAQPQYVYPMDEKAAKSAARNLFPDWPDDKFEREFLISLREHQQRPESYFTEGTFLGQKRVGVYADFTDQDVIQNAERILRDTLRDNGESGTRMTTDLTELVRAVKEIYEADNGKSLAGFLNWSVATAKPVKYYQNDDSRPILRFATPLDQLDLLMLNSDVSILKWVPFGVGVDHVGTFFAIEIADASNLDQALKKMKDKLNQGEGFSFLMPEREKIALRNMITHFEVLENAHRNGYLRIIQRLFQGLIRSTPPKHQDKQDKNLNHAWWLSETARFGMLSRATLSLSSVVAQGQVPNLVRAIFGTVRSVNIEDPQERFKLHRLVAMATQSQTPSVPSLVAHTTARLLDLSRKPTEFDSLKESSFHLLASLPRAADRVTGVLESAVLLQGEGQLQVDLVDWALDELAQPFPSSVLGRAGMNLLQLSDPRPLRELALRLLGPAQGYPESHLAALADMIVTIAKKDRASLRAFQDALQAYMEDSRVDSLGPYGALKNLVGYGGLLDLFRATLKDPQDRRIVQKVLAQLAAQGALSKIAQNMVEADDAGDLDRFIILLETYLIRKDVR